MYLDKKVDLLITYVNHKDARWQADYMKTSQSKLNPASIARFRSFGTLRYLFRGIDKFMPYVDRVILIVAYESQVPKWVNWETVKVLTHDKFIPATARPTFNSCTIESNFHRITNLAPYIIYMNDDIYPIEPSTIDDFYTNALPNTHFKFYKGFAKDNMFRQQCKNGADLIFRELKKRRLVSEDKENAAFFKPDHCASALTLDSLRTVGYLCGDELRKLSTPFRSLRNVNQHIYLYYQYFTDKYYNKAIDYEYVTFVDSIDSIVNDIVHPKHKFICINDNGLTSDLYNDAKVKVQKAFIELLPDKCKFEV